jgi:zinc transport system permease protein
VISQALSAWPLAFLSYDFMRNALVGVLLIAPLFGLAGTLVVSNRLSFYSDALGHAALAGIAIGTLIGLKDPLFALIVFSILFGLGITAVKNRGRASTDTILGIFSASAVALGIALLSRRGGFARYSAYLVGDILSIQRKDLIVLGVALAGLLLFWLLSYNSLMLYSINPALARSKGIRIHLVENAFMVIIAILVALAIQWVGTLLINALLILPASAARNLARNIRQFHVLSLAFAWLSSIGGLILSYYLDMATGATIVLCAAVIFAVTYGVAARTSKA